MKNASQNQITITNKVLKTYVYTVFLCKNCNNDVVVFHNLYMDTDRFFTEIKYLPHISNFNSFWLSV